MLLITDWEKWMAEHHIRLKGDPYEYRTDEIKTGGTVSGTEVETKGDGNAGKTGHSNIQKHESKRKT